MAFRRYYRASKPKKRTIEVKFAAPCACCGATIKAGQLADYYPAGTIASIHVGRIAHIGGLDGNSRVCFGNLKNQVDAATNDYAGDGLDARWEDSFRDTCGL